MLCLVVQLWVNIFLLFTVLSLSEVHCFDCFDNENMVSNKYVHFFGSF